jgi:GH24 family phage-related lysozyme (muramidase)
MSAKSKAAAVALALAITAPAEGLRNYAYRDPVGIPTICFGSTKGVKMGDYQTTDECKTLLTKEMSAVIEQVDKCAPGLPVNVLAAFASASYNLGSGLACNSKTSTAARLLKARNYAAACMQLPRWNKAKIAGVSVALPGLTDRRDKEMQLCLS